MVLFELLVVLLTTICSGRALSDSDQVLVNGHFSGGRQIHINKPAIEFLLQKLNGKSIRIVETGTSAWGFDSTRFWDQYVTIHGDSLVSVDVRKAAGQKLLAKGAIGNRTTLIVDHSVNFLKKMLAKGGKNNKGADLYFFDSWDVDWKHPVPSAEHGLLEFQAIQPYLRKGDMVFVDDTPVNMTLSLFIGMSDIIAVANEFFQMHQQWPGKGAYILKEISLLQTRFKIIFHYYSVIIEVIS